MATYIAAYQTGDDEHRLQIDADRMLRDEKLREAFLGVRKTG